MGDAALPQLTPRIAAAASKVDPTASVVWHPLELEDHAIDETRTIRVVVVGAGIAGITAAILLPAKVPGLDLVVYERDSDIIKGGIWHQCTYPGVRCDVPSHVYQSTFSPSLDWTEHYARGHEIKAYWGKVAKKYNADKYIRCNHEVLSAQWSEEKGKWLVSVRHDTEMTVDEVDFVIMATGIFSHPTLPDYPGFADYSGSVIHSSRWDPSFEPAGKNVAVIGNGASGMQVVPELQKIVKRIDHYARSPTWVAGSFGGDAALRDLPKSFDDPEAYMKYRKELENMSFTGFGGLIKNGDKNKAAQAKYAELMRTRLGSRIDILEAITPDFPPSCRRLTPGPGYLEALVEPNVEYISTPIERITKTGIKTKDGKEREVDAIICCTGSDKSFAPPFPLVSGGVDLAAAWRRGGSIGFPNTYMGVAAPGFPNLLFINGPGTATATGTLPFGTETQISLAARILRKVQTQGIRSIAPSLQATEDFRAYAEAYFPRTVLTENCRSWFNGGVSGGRPIANWPGSGLHASLVRREPRWEDWEYKYWSSSGNRFAYLGNGWTRQDIEVNGDVPDGAEAPFVDMTPYLHVLSVNDEVDLKSYHES
ncbi:FAD/NAD(P)-binding domain-containing protein [Thozetella sp. PMI_491]|nr:FAD/NAD(P)-binding domain-containing protein [Thozetella sp. PMI_491]